MKKEYCILWFDDEVERINGYEDNIRLYLESIGFALKTERISQFSEQVLSDVEEAVRGFNPYNLILVDHHLSDGKDGASFAKRLRDVVYTDIVYYSDEDARVLREKLFKAEVDGVHISNRMHLHEDVKCIIEDQVKRDFDAINMRGFVLDALSQMEGLLRDKYAEYFQSLSADEREQKIQEMIHAIGTRQGKLQERIEKLRAIGDASGMLNCTSLVTLDVVRDALKGLVPEGERILGSKSDFHMLQEGRNRWAHDSISLDKSGQRVILSNDKSHKEGYGREEFKKMRVLLGSVGAELETCVKGLIFDARGAE